MDVVYISFICNVDDQNETVKTTSRSWISSSLASNFDVQEGNKLSWRNRKYRVTRKLVCQERKYLSLVLVFAAGFVLVTYFAFFKSFFDTSRLSLAQTCSLTSQAFRITASSLPRNYGAEQDFSFKCSSCDEFGTKQPSVCTVCCTKTARSWTPHHFVW